MKRILAVAAVALTAFAMVGADTVDARRLGGGRSLGAQRQSVAPPPSPSAPAAAPSAAGPTGAASNPVMPPGAATARGATTAAAPAAAAAGAARTGMSRWMGPLAGVAAGLGLAWLAHSLGFSEALLSAMLIGLAIVVGIAIVRMLLARRAGAGPGTAPYAGAAAGTTANARTPFEAAPRPAPRFEPSFASSPPVDASRGRSPAGFDAPAFLDQARKQFTRLQAAYDAGDRALLSDVMTPGLFAEVASDLDARVSHVPTEVVALNPEIVEVTTEGTEHWASVRFRGLLREDGSPMPKPFDELWNLVKPADGSSGWLLAGIRQLDEAPAGQA